MDAKLINPFIEAVNTVLQQLGFTQINKSKVAVNETNVVGLGVMSLVGLTGTVSGNVVYNMPAATGCFIASKMMFGMPVEEFNEMAQSAISELSNMMTARVATNLTELGYTVDISTPNLSVGDNMSVRVCDGKFLTITMEIEGHVMEINIYVVA